MITAAYICVHSVECSATDIAGYDAGSTLATMEADSKKDIKDNCKDGYFGTGNITCSAAGNLSGAKCAESN